MWSVGAALRAAILDLSEAKDRRSENGSHTEDFPSKTDQNVGLRSGRRGPIVAFRKLLSLASTAQLLGDKQDP